MHTQIHTECAGLREEASIAASNSASASHEFSQGEFAQRLLGSLSNLIAFVQSPDLDFEGAWLLSDIVGVGNAVVGEKLRQLLTVIQQLKVSESNLHRRTADLVQGNTAVAQLQERVATLERELVAKRKAVETLSMQLDMESVSLGGVSRRNSPRGASAQQTEMLQREMQNLAGMKANLEEENKRMRQQTVEMEESNNALRSQLVAARREIVDSAGLLASRQQQQQVRVGFVCMHACVFVYMYPVVE